MIARRDFPGWGPELPRKSVSQLQGLVSMIANFSPPHEFNVNVPKAMSRARAGSYQAYAWPRIFSGLFARNGLAISVIARVKRRGIYRWICRVE